MGDQNESELLLESQQRALEANISNQGSLIYRLPRELTVRIVAFVALDSGREFIRLQRSARVFSIQQGDSIFWEMLCREYYDDCDAARAKYLSWHQMFCQRPQLRYDGVYVCTSTYMRRAEQEGVRSWYQPLVEVTYYRYLRLCRDGSAQALVTVNEPGQVLPFEVGYDKANRGHWRVDRDRNVLALSLSLEPKVKGYASHMAFRVRSTENRLHNKLDWKRFEVGNLEENQWDKLSYQKEGNFIFNLI